MTEYAKRYELRHPTYGRGLRFTHLEAAKRELEHCVPRAEWRIWDRNTRTWVDV